MLIVVRCVLRAAPCLRALVRCLLRVVCWLSLAACCIGVCWLFVECSIGCCLLVTNWCLLFGGLWLLVVGSW